MSKQRQRDRAKRRKAFKVILGGKEIEKRAKDLLIHAREQGMFPQWIILNKRTNHMQARCLKKAQCTGIKLNGKKQISAYFWDSGKEVTFIGTLAEREDGTFMSQTMETNKMGKYSMSPETVTDCIGRFVWEYEHWLTGLFEYADKEGITIAWRPLDLAFRHFNSLDDAEKDGPISSSLQPSFGMKAGKQLNEIYAANADGAFHNSLRK